MRSRIEGESTKPSPCFIVYRVSDARPGPRCAACSVLSAFSAFAGRAADFGIRQGVAIQSLKDDVIERSPVISSRGSSSNETLTFFTRCTAGHVSPLASLVDCNLARVETGRVSHDARFSSALGRLSHFRSLHVTVDPNRVEKPRSQDHDLDPMRWAQARANGHAFPSNPKRV